jgi:hypothetical protein
VPSEPSYDLVVAALAVRAIAEELPEAVAVASIDLITGPLLENPDRPATGSVRSSRASGQPGEHVSSDLSD